MATVSEIVWPTLASAESGSEKGRSCLQIEFLPGLLLFFPLSNSLFVFEDCLLLASRFYLSEGFNCQEAIKGLN